VFSPKRAAKNIQKGKPKQNRSKIVNSRMILIKKNVSQIKEKALI
jgi:hypothetical protein